MLWSEHLRPKKFTDIISTNNRHIDILKHIKTNTKPLLIIGPPGIGKTSTVSIISKLCKYDLVEINASDHKLIDKITYSYTSTTKTYTSTTKTQQNLQNNKILLLIDEIDKIPAEQYFINKILNIKNIPVVLLANTLPNIKYLKEIKNIIYLQRLGINIIRDKIIQSLDIISKEKKYINIRKNYSKENNHRIENKHNLPSTDNYNLKTKNIPIHSDNKYFIENNLLNRIIEESSRDLRFIFNTLQLYFNTTNTLSNKNMKIIKNINKSNYTIIEECLNNK
ncbi:Replication factor C large subunit, partial [Spraguea lophii 42_110]